MGRVFPPRKLVKLSMGITMLTRKTSRIAASEHTPWIGVHELTEFIFCSRAGIIAHENRGHSVDDELPNLRYSRDWSVREMKRTLRVVQLRAGYLLVAVCSLAIVSWLSTQLMVRAACVLGLSIAAVSAFKQLRQIVAILIQLRRARRATATIPDRESTDGQTVNWWSLLNAGFESVRYNDPLSDEQVRLTGRPWRVLRKDSLRIPVFRLKSEPRLRRQHYARMAAYCHLLKTCEGADSPYGVIIFANSYDGVTVRDSPSARKAFHDELIRARVVVERSRSGSFVRPPENLHHCAHCPLGYPSLARRGWWFRPSNKNARQGADGRFYESECGNRFSWGPPHEKAVRKRISRGRTS